MQNTSKFIILLCVLAVASSPAVSDLLRVPLSKSQSDTKSINFCQGCRSLVSYATKFNSSSQRDNYRKVLTDYCEANYPTSTDYQQGPCPIFVEGFFYLIDRVDPVTHCDEIGACGEQDEPTKMEETNSIPKLLGGQACDACEQIVTQLQGELANPNSVELVKKLLTSFCDYLAIIDQSKQCRQLFENYIDMAIDFLRQIQPLKFCQSVELCSQADRKLLPTPSKKPILSTPSLATFQGFGIETKVVIGDKVVKDLNAPEQVQKGHGPGCILCKTVIKEMFQFLKNNRTEENIRNGLDQVCQLAFRGHRSKVEQCEQLVAAYSREMMQMLIDETDPELICMLLEQCTHQSSFLAEEEEKPLEPVDLGMFISMLDPSVPLGSIGTCVECKLFIQYLRDEIGDPKSEDQIKNWLLSNLCSSLDDNKSKDACINMVNTYAATFFKAVSSELNPKKACIELKACTQRVRFETLNLRVPLNNRPMIAEFIKPELTTSTKKPTLPLKSQICDQCIQIVTQIDEYLSSHPIDHDVSVLVEEVCDKMPSESAKSECTVLVKVFGDDIAQAISTMESPKQLCTKIMVC